MRSLYVRIALTFIGISLLSGLLALLVVNVYYTNKLKGYSEQKVMKMAKEIRELLEGVPEAEWNGQLNRIGSLGFQLYVVDDRLKGRMYGSPFKHDRFDPEQARRVLAGDTYDGLTEQRRLLNVSGYFENSIANTVGLPVHAEGRAYALFVRPDLEQQIGEVRILLAVLLGSAFAFSIGFIVIFTRHIVKPVRTLTEATRTIIEGRYDIGLDVSRRDEIGNLARHFSQMAQSLKRLDDMRQEFVANVSHEIGSPLTSIQGFARTILDNAVSPEEARRYLEIVEEESKRLSGLSRQLLTLASLDKETNAVKRTAFRLDEQIRHVLLMTEWQWTDKGLSLEPDLPEIVVTADPELLVQVWLNLMTNAIKFSRPGGTIRIRLTVDDAVTVTVEDTGIGIPAADLPHVFERFYKADKARNRSRSGSGLGLSIARKIVELHRGTIRVDSEPGAGTTFTVRLPRS
ncbi:sensor histidine kinase [Paenibacillus flagellatus]|uniref:Heme sensor protein HssS n=1 Tax=Paenibacillus flagellatus TaxID=2211139 RepID=A0A2V5JZ22_9BACL|nr:ATP-binding protein [Paenibacillus flagellatus]PYI52175.1 sensor histidine kinase [Paenibacillus flagellatus]